jgi:molecular chaperone Hsp33
MADRLIRGILGDGIARVFVIDVTGIAEQTRQLHKLRGDAVSLAAEAAVAAIVMAGQIKGEERLSLQLQCSRPQCAFIADVDSSGGVRARFTPEVVFLSEKTGLDGMILAIKSLPGRELYRGVTAIEQESIVDALNRHIGASAQVDNILNISVSVANDGSVSQAVGILIERLPASAVSDLEASAEFVVTFDPVREMAAAEIVGAIEAGQIQGSPLEILDQTEVNWRCSCGPERVEAVLLSLPVEEITAMLKEDGQAEVICHFCNVSYVIPGERLEQMVVAKTPEDVN